LGRAPDAFAPSEVVPLGAASDAIALSSSATWIGCGGSAAAVTASIADRRSSGHAKKWLAILICATVGYDLARADEPLALETVTVKGVAEIAPTGVTEVSIENRRPESLVPRRTIEQIASPFADFGTLSNLTPSFVSSAPNGNGFDAAKNMTLRGFPDGQFIVTLDGIPFADPDGFAHHSTSVFPASSIEQLLVDRSPGGGTTLGYATIGGSLNIQSRAMPATAQAQVYGAYGSFATYQAGVLLSTANPGPDGGAGLLANYQHLQSDGAMSNADGRRDDILLRAEARFDAGTQLSLLYSYDSYHFKNAPSVSTAQIEQFGPGFGFTATPGEPAYAGYAQTDRTTDFGYARLRAGWSGGFDMVDTLYTYSYSSQGSSLKGDVTASPVGPGFGVPPSNIGGRFSDNSYRTFGNILHFEQAQETRALRAGLWLERSHQVNKRNALDLTTGQPYNANTNAHSPVLFDYDSVLETIEPYAEYVWQPVSALTTALGLRYQVVRREFNARVVPNSLPGTDGYVNRTVNSLLPSAEGNYALTEDTHAYLQWSKGALVPNQSFFYTSDPAHSNQAQPQTSQAFQGGLIYVTGPVQATLDTYWIDVDNYVSTINTGGTTQYVNDGKVRYQGIETEGRLDIGAGFSGVFNASVMRAQFRTSGVTSAAQQAGDRLPLAPTYTALVGLLYGQGAWTGSLLVKFVGTQYQGKNGSADGANFRVEPYHYTNFTVSRMLDDVVGARRSRLSLRIDNVENRAFVTDVAGPSAAGPLLVNVLPRRSYLVTFECDL
jgi:iron complex outermembrane receptor protein